LRIIEPFSIGFNYLQIGNIVHRKTNPRMKKITLAILPLLLCLISNKIWSQAPNKSDSTKDIGVAVTPAHLNYNLKTGESKTYEIKVTNETKMKRSFKVTLKDFDMDKSGKSSFMEAGKSEHSLSAWISVSPTFMELAPGTMQKIKVTLNVPDSEGTNRAAWCILMVEEAKERQALEPDGNDQKIALGIIPSFAFGVYIYQNPPFVSNNKVEIKRFDIQKQDNKARNIEMSLVNTGNGIAFCTAYVEITNQNTGKQQRLMVKRFTILPGYTRNYLYGLPTKLEKGKYSVVGVLDFGSKEVIETAENEFVVE
jgi:hypothetical protein